MGDVRGRGLLLGVELVKDKTSKVPATTMHPVHGCLKERGLLLGKGGLMGNVIRIAPPISIKKEQIHFMLETMDQAFAEIEKRRST